jgi:hypothetical protein
VALPDCTCPTFLRRSMTIGMEPKMSMTEKSIRVTEMISLKLNMIYKFFAKLVNHFQKGLCLLKLPKA